MLGSGQDGRVCLIRRIGSRLIGTFLNRFVQVAKVDLGRSGKRFPWGEGAQSSFHMHRNEGQSVYIAGIHPPEPVQRQSLLVASINQQTHPSLGTPLKSAP